MALIAYLRAALTQRLRELRTAEESDRGDNPVPTAVIIVGLAILAVGVLAWAYTLTDGFMGTAIPDMPDVPTGG